MEKRMHLYVNKRNAWVWLAVLCLLCACVGRIAILGFMQKEILTSVWVQIVIPVFAAAMYIAILLFQGDECFYKTAIPVWVTCGYAALIIANGEYSRLYVWLFWIALLFFAFLYTEIVSGMRKTGIWLLFPMMLAALALVLYNQKAAIYSRNQAALMRILPDLLTLAAGIFTSFAVRVHSDGLYHRRWGDRSDGRRIRTLAPMDQVSPYIMVNRNTASNSFEESFEITNMDRYIRQKRREGLTNFGVMHVFLACYCRTIAKYPGLNRFISGQKVYTHGEDIQFCLTIKKEMSTTSPETIIKVHLSPRDSAYDVYQKVNAELEKAKNTPLDSGFDNTAHAFMLVPGVFLKFLVWLLKTLDYFGMLPKFLLEVSPFHGSIFFTSMGSLGIPPIYHHLYDFGNLPVFCAFGCKRKAVEVQEDGTVETHKYIDFKFTMDERIVDGYYYAAFFKQFRRIIMKPELLDVPPEVVASDID